MSHLCFAYTLYIIRGNALFLAVSVAAHELIYATGGVNQLRLTGVEGMRCARDFELYQGISFAFELDGLLGCYS